jgi:hypothetical protein
LYNLKFHNFICSPNIFMVSKSRNYWNALKGGNFKEWTECGGRAWPKADQERRLVLNEEKVSADCGKRPGSQK